MRIIIRVFAMLIAVFSVASIALGSYGLLNARDMASLLGLLVARFDSADWLTHWRAAMAYILLCGAVGLPCSVTMLRGRPAGFRVWAWLSTAVLLCAAVVYSASLAKYPFEVYGLSDLLTLAVVAVTSWLAYGYAQRKAPASEPPN
jgi:hypothetical protein